MTEAHKSSLSDAIDHPGEAQVPPLALHPPRPPVGQSTPHLYIIKLHFVPGRSGVASGLYREWSVQHMYVYVFALGEGHVPLLALRPPRPPEGQSTSHPAL